MLPYRLLDEHRTGFLHVVGARMQGGVKCEERALVEIPSHFSPAHGMPGNCRPLLSGIQPDTHR